jgi:PAS domain S-box-containing protein
VTDDPLVRTPADEAVMAEHPRAGRLVHSGDLRLPMVPALVVGVVAGVVAIAVKALLDAVFDGDTGYILLMASVVAAAWYAGLVGGIAANITAVVLNALVLVDPAGVPVVDDRVELVRLILFLVVGTATAVLVGSRRAARDRLEDAVLEVASLAEKVETRDTRLELMLAASGTGFWEWDVTTGVLEWSEAIFRQHGLKPGGVPPTFDAYLDMIHPDDRAGFQETISVALEEEERFNHEFRVVWPDGSVHWTHGSGRVFRDDAGRPIRMLGTGQDITERRRLEAERDELIAEERRAAAYREAFIDVISHELRTPITTILGLTQILARPGRSDDESTRSTLLEDIRAEAERLHRLVEDLLVLSRVERGRLTAELDPLQPTRLLERIVAHEAVELPSLDIELRLEPGLPIVGGEETYVEQIVRNLLGNAAKYTAPGTKVVIDARRDGPDAVAIRVLDHGPGIAEASLPRIFELFYRDPDSARSVAGSGIGLFVCSNLVEAMGGRIWAARRPEGGSEFGFTLQVLEPDASDHRDDEIGLAVGPV